MHMRSQTSSRWSAGFSGWRQAPVRRLGVADAVRGRADPAGGPCRAMVRKSHATPPPEAAAAAASAEVPIQGDLGVEDLRDRAVLLRRPGQLLELAPVDARDLTFQRQRRLADLEALSL